MSAWDRAARFYDLQLGLERAALDAAIELTELSAGERLLDLGTGTGALLRRLVRGSVLPKEAVGIDPSAAMLERAPPLPEGWHLFQADAAHLPFPPRSFDVVCAAYLLHLLDAGERARILGEARRVIRPGGRIVVITIAPPRRLPLARLLAAASSRAPGVVAGLRPLDPRADLEAAGFEILKARATCRGYPSLIVLARLLPVRRAPSRG
ncbi:MAG: methyltransferase domain-containing protein [Solirubrobacterales bacterium]